MKNMSLKFALAFLAGVFCTAINADEPVKSYTFPNGKTIENPYVISERPDGIQVGHKNGAMFVKFKDLPEEIQKKFNYDPAKAEAYEKKLADAKAASQKEKADKAAKMKEEQERQNKRLAEWNKEKLVAEINKTENRIQFLKSEIPKLEMQCGNLLNKSADLAGKNVSDNGSSSGYNYSWGGGYVTSGSGTRAETTKRKAISTLTEEYAASKKKLTSYNTELQKKIDDLDAMKRRQEKSAN